MRTMTFFLSILIGPYMLMSCSNPDREVVSTSSINNSAAKKNASEVLVRLENASNLPFQNVRVSLPGAKYTFNTLKPGETSGYQSFAKAYAYAGIELEANGKPYMLMPYDYVGEQELATGHYTYVLSLDPTTNQLVLTFRAD